jgi:hypothetical protein
MKKWVGTAIGWAAVCVMMPVLIVCLWIWEWWGRLRGKTWD